MVAKAREASKISTSTFLHMGFFETGKVAAIWNHDETTKKHGKD